MKEKQMNNKGFTLLELTMSIVISAFVIVAAYTIVITGTKSYETTNKTVNVQQEMSFVNNLVGEAVRAGDNRTALIWKESADGDKVLYLGDSKKVICYKASENSLYVYEATNTPYVYTGGVLSSINVNVLKDYLNSSDRANHLISKYVDRFDIDCETNDTSVIKPGEADYQAAVMLIDDSAGRNFSMVRIKMTMKYLKKSDSAEVVYQIRN